MSMSMSMSMSKSSSSSSSKSKSMSMECVEKGIRMCASKYNFDAEECLRLIMDNMDSKKKKTEVLKSKFALPYNGEMNGDLCFGISRNNGLYTQCTSNRKSDEAYCSKCSKQAAANEHGLPDYGNIQDRVSKYNKNELFVDPSGKSPIAFVKIMKKLKLSEEDVRMECERMGITIDPRHFEVTAKKSGRPKQVKPEKEEKEAKPKGRPKKSKKVLELAGEEEDLFASLVMSANTVVNNDVKEEVTVEVKEEVKEEVVEKPVKDKKKKVSEDKEEKKLALQKEKEEKKLALQKEKEEKKLALQKEKEEKKLALQKEKEEKKLALEKEKEAKKFLKELEKQEKQAIAEIKKENKEKKETKKEKKVEAKVEEKVEAKVEAKVEEKVEEKEEADVVKKIVFEGKKYLKSKKTGIIYNMEQDVIGKWNEEKQRIDFNAEGEESEDEYDEDM